MPPPPYEEGDSPPDASNSVRAENVGVFDLTYNEEQGSNLSSNEADAPNISTTSMGNNTNTESMDIQPANSNVPSFADAKKYETSFFNLKKKIRKKKANKAVRVSWNSYLSQGVDKEIWKKLLESSSVPANCTMLNCEFQAMLSSVELKKGSFLNELQGNLSKDIEILGAAITDVMGKKSQG
nr:unnamed protein product [Callosobruchus analis]